MNAWFLTAFGIYAAMLLMFVAWFFSRRLNNAAYGEVAWVGGFALVAGMFAALGPGHPTRKILIAVLVALWSARLVTLLLIRCIRNGEGPRHAILREKFPKRPWLMFFGLFQLQAVLLGLLSAPFAAACSNSAPSLHPWEIAGVMLWLIAFTGETLADLQLRRALSASPGQLCRTGLWRYSRHPNYFFEWLIWIAYFLFALGSPGGWITIYCPLLMLHILLNVSGIPPTESHALKTLGRAYEEYQRATSPFLLRPPRPARS